MDTIHLPCYDHDYEYTINNPDPCNQYNITLTVEANVSTCIDSRSVVISGIEHINAALPYIRVIILYSIFFFHH